MFKICPKCKIEKPISDFSKCSARKHLDGVRYECKACAVLARKKWAESNPQKIKDYDKKFYQKHGEKIRQRVREWSALNPDKKKSADDNYRSENKERIKSVQKVWREANSGLLKQKKKRYLENNSELIIAKRKVFYWSNREELIRKACEFKKANRGLYNFYGANRKERIRRATPAWLSPAHRKEIKEIYEAAGYVSLITGEPYQVDHIVPLLGKIVCGLHVPWNLQVLTASENASKGNRWAG